MHMLYNKKYFLHELHVPVEFALRAKGKTIKRGPILVKGTHLEQPLSLSTCAAVVGCLQLSLGEQEGWAWVIGVVLES